MYSALTQFRALPWIATAVLLLLFATVAAAEALSSPGLSALANALLVLIWCGSLFHAIYFIGDAKLRLRWAALLGFFNLLALPFYIHASCTGKLPSQPQIAFQLTRGVSRQRVAMILGLMLGAVVVWGAFFEYMLDGMDSSPGLHSTTILICLAGLTGGMVLTAVFHIVAMIGDPARRLKWAILVSVFNVLAIPLYLYRQRRGSL